MDVVILVFYHHFMFRILSFQELENLQLFTALRFFRYFYPNSQQSSGFGSRWFGHHQPRVLEKSQHQPQGFLSHPISLSLSCSRAAERKNKPREASTTLSSGSLPIVLTENPDGYPWCGSNIFHYSPSTIRCKRNNWQLFIASYYRQLSAEIKCTIIILKRVLSKLLLILLFYIFIDVGNWI